MELQSNSLVSNTPASGSRGPEATEIAETPGLEGLSRTLRVAEVIYRRDLDFVIKPGKLVQSEFRTGSLSAAARNTLFLMLRKAGLEAGDERTFAITKKELR